MMRKNWYFKNTPFLVYENFIYDISYDNFTSSFSFIKGEFVVTGVDISSWAIVVVVRGSSTRILRG